MMRLSFLFPNRNEVVGGEASLPHDVKTRVPQGCGTYYGAVVGKLWIFILGNVRLNTYLCRVGT